MVRRRCRLGVISEDREEGKGRGVYLSKFAQPVCLPEERWLGSSTGVEGQSRTMPTVGRSVGWCGEAGERGLLVQMPSRGLARSVG
jgi:hypothetical protein